ncbi:phosphoserine phosphatase SerB [Catenovulum agarivorans DS-2]|uniref:Phosphoserine phosphatase n=1 Tax=Catenovulum agarivorans DS-2 TaxID=1328313 RepID=W7QHD3_9ALTE|nr:phosphoserine phosphatase SerB [Catenovulum agarivorans]EWH12354.1 phosphoserine phosphatase SerB [Catenovulum agarivorans DS-2]
MENFQSFAVSPANIVLNQALIQSLDLNAEQQVVLNPQDLTQYQIQAYQGHQNKLELIAYAQQLTSTQIAGISQLLADSVDANQWLRVITAGDNQGAIGLAWQLTETLPDDKKQALVEFAANSQIEIWQAAVRPQIQQAGLLLMDMDSTTIKIECIDEIAKLAGVGEEVAKVTELAMQGKLDFAESLRGRVATLKGCPVDVLDKVANDLPLMHGLARLVKVLKQHDWRVAIASGGFTYFADKLKNDLGLDAAVANTLKIADGKLLGEVEGRIVDAQVKAETLQALADQFAVEHSQTIAMGDGANDLTMMAASALGVAFEAKPIVQQKASVAINHHGLDALLYLIR